MIKTIISDAPLIGDLNRFFWRDCDQSAPVPLSFLKMLRIEEVFAVSISEVGFILSLVPVPSFCPKVFAFSMHPPPNKISLVVWPIGFFEGSLPFNPKASFPLFQLALIGSARFKFYLNLNELLLEILFGCNVNAFSLTKGDGAFFAWVNFQFKCMVQFGISILPEPL